MELLGIEIKLSLDGLGDYLKAVAGGVLCVAGFHFGPALVGFGCGFVVASMVKVER